MSENIEELKRLRHKNIDFRDRLIPILEDLEKRLKTIEAEMGIYTEEEIKKIKVGGTDSD